MSDSNIALHAVLEKVAKVTSTAATELQNELSRLEVEKKRIVADIDAAANRIRQSLRSLGQNLGLALPAVAHRSSRRARMTTVTRGRGSRKQLIAQPAKAKRIRRGPDEIKRDAELVYQLIKGKGAEGAKGAEIRKRHPKVAQDIRAYVEKFTSHKLKTVGSKAAMRYIAV